MVFSTSFKKIFRGMFSPEMLSLLFLLFMILLLGTAFYSIHENWSIVDAFYFSAMTITTAGFGDLHPTSDISKLFTVFYIFLGLGVVLAFVQALVQHSHHEKLMSKIIHHETKEE